MNIEITQKNVKNLKFHDLLNRIIHQNKYWNKEVRLKKIFKLINNIKSIDKTFFIKNIFRLERKYPQNIFLYPGSYIVDIFIYDKKRNRQFGYIKVKNIIT